MKNGNWVPIDATMAKYLPLDRPYTVIEAIYCLQLNYDKGSTVTVAGLAKLWGWKSRGKVSRFLEAIGVEIVYHKDMEKSRNKRGVLVFSKRTYDEHKTDIERTNNGHIRLINNKWLDYETDIKRAYGGHKPDIGCSTINHTTDPYPEKEKEGGTDDRDRNLGNGSGSDTDPINGSQRFENESIFTASIPDGESTQSQYKGKGDVCGIPGNNGDNNNGRTGEESLPYGGSLNGPDNANARTGLDIPGPGEHCDTPGGDSVDCAGDSGTVGSVDGQAPIGEEGAELDREGEIGHGMVGLGDNRDNSNSSGEDNRNRVSGANRVTDSGNMPADKAGDNGIDGGVSNGMGDNRRVDTGDHGGVSLSDKGELNHDILEEKEENEAKPPARSKKKKSPIPYREIVDHFNRITGKSYRHTSKQTMALIRARWSEGFVVDDFVRVISHINQKWKCDPKMSQYLRPHTLFNGKFESYLQDAPVESPIGITKDKKKELERLKARYGDPEKPIITQAHDNGATPGRVF